MSATDTHRPMPEGLASRPYRFDPKSTVFEHRKSGLYILCWSGGGTASVDLNDETPRTAAELRVISEVIGYAADFIDAQNGGES